MWLDTLVLCSYINLLKVNPTIFKNNNIKHRVTKHLAMPFNHFILERWLQSPYHKYFGISPEEFKIYYVVKALAIMSKINGFFTSEPKTSRQWFDDMKPANATSVELYLIRAIEYPKCAAYIATATPDTIDESTIYYSFYRTIRALHALIIIRNVITVVPTIPQITHTIINPAGIAFVVKGHSSTMKDWGTAKRHLESAYRCPHPSAHLSFPIFMEVEKMIRELLLMADCIGIHSDDSNRRPRNIPFDIIATAEHQTRR